MPTRGVDASVTVVNAAGVDVTPTGANAAAGTTGTGLAGSGALLWDGTNWEKLKGNVDGTLPTGGFSTLVTAVLTRPADTNAYAAGDEVTDTGGAIRTLTGAARVSGGSGVITGVLLAGSTIWTVAPQWEIWLFDTTSTPVTDNAAFAPTDGVTATCIGVIPLSTVYAGTVNFTMDSGPLSLPFVTVGSANLYARLVIRNAGQDSANSSTVTMRFRILQD